MPDIIEISDAQAWGIGLACVMMLADVLVGFVGAAIDNSISSTKMRKGLLHKVLMLVLVFACLAIELAAKHAFQLPYDVPTCEVVCGYIVVMELASIIENIGSKYPGFADSPLFRLFDLGHGDDDDVDPGSR